MASQLVIDRRTFLRAAGLTAMGAVSAARVVGAERPAAHTDASPAQLGHDPILAQAAALDYDREAIFRFVADEIAYEPYPGLLRGPRATLSGRAGNATDKAALLGALLEASLIEVRFQEGILDEPVVARLTAIAVDPAEARDRARVAASSATAGVAGAPPEASIRPVVDRLPDIDASVTAWASKAVDSGAGTIVAALSGAGIEVPLVTDLPEVERTRHLWVQTASGSDWLDLDPTIAGTTAGGLIASATVGPMDAIPDDLRHRIDIAVTVERIAGTAFALDTVIEHTVFADELTDVPIAIGHARPEGLQAVGVALDRILTGGVRYQAILQVDQSAHIGTTGLLISSGDAGVLDAGDSTSHEGEATAEWLEVSVTSPGGGVTTTRRTLFDRVGEAARRAGPVDPARIPPVRLVDVGPDDHAGVAPLHAVHFLSVATGATRRPVMPSASSGDERTIAALRLPAPMYHVARDTTNALVGLDRGAAVHLDAPNIVMHSYVPVVDADGSVTVHETLDILHRSFATLPVQGVPSQIPLPILAGVTSHVAERLRMGEGLPADLVSAAPGLSAGAILERAAREGVALRVLHDTLPAGAAYPDEAASRLETALSEGWVAIVPERALETDGAPRLGWWLVDPATGATTDMLDDGRGVTMVEWATIAVLVEIAAAVALYCIGSASNAAAWNAWAAEMKDLAGQLGADVGDLPAKQGACS